MKPCSLIVCFISLSSGLLCQAQKALPVVDLGPIPFFDSTKMIKAVEGSPFPTLFNIFLIQKPLQAREQYYDGFTDTSLRNGIKKLNATTYQIDVNDISKKIILVNSFEAGYSFEVSNNQDPNPATINWRPYDQANSLADRSLSFDPYFTSYSLFDNRSKKKLAQFRFTYTFPEPIPILITTDTALIAKKKKNAGHNFSPSVPADKVSISPFFTTDKSHVLILFEHFLRNARSEKLDQLEYKINNSDWSSTALSYTPSILLEDLQPGKYLLYVKYSAEKAKLLKFELEILPPVKHSILWWALGSVVLSALLFYTIYRIRIKAAQQKAQKTRLELQAIQSQLNPHFMFNALGSVQYLMHNNEKQKADHYLTEFSALLRSSLSNNENEMIPLSRELQVLNSYIALEQLRFGFRYQCTIGRGIAPDTIPVPTLLMQPLVENAIKHGLSSLREKGLLEIRVQQQESDLLIAIIDNGPGFAPAQLYTGLGTKLVKERIGLLRRNGYQVELSFATDQKNETKVCLKFRNWA